MYWWRRDWIGGLAGGWADLLGMGGVKHELGQWVYEGEIAGASGEGEGRLLSSGPALLPGRFPVTIVELTQWGDGGGGGCLEA